MHDVIILVSGFDHFVGQIMRPAIGSADYKIVRLVFFSALAAWSAFGLACFMRDTTFGLVRLTFIRVPVGAFRLAQRLGPEVGKMVDQIKSYRVSWPLGSRKQNQVL